ncbi:MAG: molybdopterin-dependent oxidoreductase [Acidimicrobiales bacterium]|nr:molybdopterin-dependent oxidoreductase [Acidimicrobiales bacterium]
MSTSTQPPDTTSVATGPLPPGQRLVERFPRFGAHLWRPAPAVPADPVITIGGGAVTSSFDLPVAALADLPRTEVTADFHCVSGWSAAGLRWEGVAFDTFFRTVVEPEVAPGTTVTHLVFVGRDGYRSVVLAEDVLAPDVLLAEHLDGIPLGADHGAPVRLVSPAQYGYVSIKHLCRIEAHGTPPPARRLSPADRLVESHPRARVWAEERHGSLPNWLIRPLYRALKAPLLYLCTRNEARNRS